MTVSAINGSSSWPVSAQTSPSPPPMTNTAKLLGLSSDQLNQDLQSGTTLSSLASQEGVSSSSLVSSIEQDLQADAPQGAQTPSSSQLAQFATDIANGVRPGGHHHHHHGGGGMNLTDTSQLLGLSTDQLNQDLQSGTTLSSLAAQQGVSSDSLLSSIESDLQANAPQGVPALSSSQLTQMATDIANGTPPVGGGSDQGGLFAGGATSARAQSNLSSLASTLGTDPSTLFSQLTSGQDLSSLLSAGSGAGYGSSLITANTGGIAIDEYA